MTGTNASKPEWCRELCCANRFCSGWTYTDPQFSNNITNVCWLYQGVAEITIPPDRAVLRLAVEHFDRSRATATGVVEKRWASVRRALVKNGILSHDIQTQMLQMHETERGSGMGSRRGTLVSRMFEVTVHDLDNLDALIVKLVDAGVSGFRQVRIGLPDKFIEHGSRRDLLQRYGLDAHSIADRAKSELTRLLRA